MDTEFIILFSGITISIILQLTTLLVFLFKFKKLDLSKIKKSEAIRTEINKTDALGVIFCRSCGNQFDNSLKKCVHCGTQR